MLEIAPDKFHDIKSHGTPAGTFLFFVTEGDLAVFYLHDSTVSNGHLENIRRQVFQASFATADGLAINIPINIPDDWVNLIEKSGFFHLIPEFGAKDL